MVNVFSLMFDPDHVFLPDNLNQKFNQLENNIISNVKFMQYVTHVTVLILKQSFFRTVQK